MNPKALIAEKRREADKKRSWKIRINGKKSSFIPQVPMSYQQVLEYMRGRFPGFKIEVGV